MSELPNSQERHKRSIYDICHSCGMKGINLPDNRKCGNCGSLDTTRYYPEGTDAESQISAPNYWLTNSKKERFGPFENADRAWKYLFGRESNDLERSDHQKGGWKVLREERKEV